LPTTVAGLPSIAVGSTAGNPKDICAGAPGAAGIAERGRAHWLVPARHTPAWTTPAPWWLQCRAASRAADGARRERAYVDLLIASTGVAGRVHTMLVMLKTRSGIKEGLAVLFRQQQALGAQEMHDWIDVDVRALLDAWSRVWTAGEPRGIELANSLVNRCESLMSVVGSGTAQGN
jgi:hypothetical protein